MDFNRKKIIFETGRKLADLRKQLNLNLEIMARRMGLSKSGYFKNENGINFPALKTLFLLLKEHNISMDWFIFNQGPKDFRTKLEAVEMEAEKERLEKEQERLKLEERKLERMGEDIKQLRELDDVMPEARELLKHMTQDPKLRYRMLLDFYEYKDQKANKEQQD